MVHHNAPPRDEIRSFVVIIVVILLVVAALAGLAAR